MFDIMPEFVEIKSTDAATIAVLKFLYPSYNCGSSI